MRGYRRTTLAVVAAMATLLAACTTLGASEITITARNDGDQPS